MAGVVVITESETSSGWSYAARLDDGAEVRVSLSWVDHDHWSGGAKPPSETVRALLEALGSARVEIPSAFDAATARRWVSDLDARVRERL